jgi:hypothetical protein
MLEFYRRGHFTLSTRTPGLAAGPVLRWLCGHLTLAIDGILPQRRSFSYCT